MNSTKIVRYMAVPNRRAFRLRPGARSNAPARWSSVGKRTWSAAARCCTASVKCDSQLKSPWVTVKESANTRVRIKARARAMARSRARARVGLRCRAKARAEVCESRRKRLRVKFPVKCDYNFEVTGFGLLLEKGLDLLAVLRRGVQAE